MRCWRVARAKGGAERQLEQVRPLQAAYMPTLQKYADEHGDKCTFAKFNFTMRTSRCRMR